jgi:hypothetical protein
VGVQAFLDNPVDRFAETADSACELVAFLDAQFAGRHGLQDGADPFSGFDIAFERLLNHDVRDLHDGAGKFSAPAR